MSKETNNDKYCFSIHCAVRWRCKRFILGIKKDDKGMFMRKCTEQRMFVQDESNNPKSMLV